MKITNTQVRDSVYRTTIDLGKHGSLSAEYRVAPDKLNRRSIAKRLDF